MSEYLRNIARRAAGLAADSPVVPALPPVMAMAGPLVADPVVDAPHAEPGVPAAPVAQIQGGAPAGATPHIQRRALLPPSPPAAAPQPLTATRAAPVTVRGALADVAGHSSRFAELTAPQPAPLDAVAMAPALTDVAPAQIVPTVHAAARPATHEPTVIEAMQPVQPQATPAPEAVAPDRPAVPREAIVPAQVAARGAPDSRSVSRERPAQENFLRDLFERLDAAEVRTPEPGALVEPVTHAPAVARDAEQHRPMEAQLVEPRAAAHVAAPPALEKRSVNVRIGTLELKVPPAEPAPAPAIADAGAGFDGFDDIRNYRL